MKAEEYRNMAALDQRHWYFLGMSGLMLAILDTRYRAVKALHILDAGSGTCWFTQALATYGNVTALDISTEALSVCRARGVKGLIQADVAQIPVKDGEFDLVVCSEVLYHEYVKDDVAVMKEFYRILKPGGRVLIKVPAHMYLFSKHDAMNLTKRRYEPNQLKEIFEASGFEIERMTYANFFLYPAIFLKRKLERLSKGAAESDIKETSKPVNRLLLAVLRAEAFLLRFVNFPQGSSLICLGRK
jgi:SAM-dependent methyltransferase